MGKRCRQVWLLCGVLVLLANPAWGRISLYEGDFGELFTSGFVRAQADLHTAQRNPSASPDIGDNTLQLFRFWSLADTVWKPPVRGLKFFSRTRVWFDLTADADGSIPEYDAFPTSYAGDGAFMRASSDDVAIELWEAWADYQRGNWWFRLGRQTIVWGDVAPTRLLDDINPLDLSWHLVLEPLGKEVFDHLRIPLWAARAAYSLPWNPDFQIEGYLSPDEFAFVSNQLPDRQSPLNVIGLPFFITLRDDIRDGRNGVSGGVRLIGAVGGVNFTVAWIQRHSGDAISVVESFVPGDTPIGGTVNLKGVHPRFDTAGLSLNYYEPTAKAVLRFEGVWDFGRPWEAVPGDSGFLRRDTWGYAIAIDRPSFIVRSDRTTGITFQFEQRIREGGQGNIAVAGRKVDQTDELFTILLSQPFRGLGGRYDEWFLDFSFLASTNNAYAFVPLLRFEPGSHWRFNVWYNIFRGPDDFPITGPTPGGFGSQTWANGVNLSASYQF